MSLCMFIAFLTLVPHILAQTLNLENAIDVCSQTVVSDLSGFLISPNYPSNYGNNLNCNIDIVVPADKVIHLYVLNFQLEQSHLCAFDYLQIYDGSVKFYNTEFCGTLSPRNFTAESYNVSVVFETDNRLTETGFLLYWETTDRCASSKFSCWNGACIPESQHCDGVRNCVDDSDEIECSQVSLSSSACGKNEVAPHFVWDLRIVGDNEAARGSWPWQALVVESDDSLLCGASVLNTQWIMTSAHCIGTNTIDNLRVYVGRQALFGTEEAQGSLLQEIVVNPGYDSATKSLDIALLKLQTALVYASNVRPICLPTNTADVEPGTQCVATGWGFVGPEHPFNAVNLRQVRMPVLDPTICSNVYGTNFTNSHLCAGDFDKGGIGVCQGDYGGPLSCLVGETTWFVMGVASYSSCGQPGYPNVFTKVAPLHQWISEVIYDGSTTAPVTTTTTSTVEPFTTTTASTEPTTTSASSTITLPVVSCDVNVVTSFEAAIITSPNYPSPYPKSIDCRWTIQSTANKVVEISFNDFDLESDNLCRFDYVEIYDGQTMYTGRRLCGEDRPRDFAAASVNVTIIFHTDDVHEKRGFNISYRTTDRCESSEYSCWNGLCIPRDQHCDGVRDCDDDSDEIECEKPPSQSKECGKVQTAPSFSWSPRVAGGSASNAGSWPWHVSLSNSTDLFPFCGGSIISESWILTSAYCVRNYENFSLLRVDAGKSGVFDPGQQHSAVQEIHQHPSFDGSSYFSDIALLKLETSLNFTTTVRPVCLLSPNSTVDLRHYAIASGFGRLARGISKPPPLQQIRLRLLNRTTCLMTYSNLDVSQLCAGNADDRSAGVCQGDSGGPLVMLIDEMTWYQVGIISNPLPCESSVFPSVFTDVSSFSTWIQRTVAISEAGTCSSFRFQISFACFISSVLLSIFSITYL